MSECSPSKGGKKLFHSQWPKREPGSRLVGGCDPYHAPRFKFSKESSFFTIGSCFARNIEEYLGRAGVRVATYDLDFPNSELKANSRRNDLLVKYTPGSIHLEIASRSGGWSLFRTKDILSRRTRTAATTTSCCRLTTPP